MSPQDEKRLREVRVGSSAPEEFIVSTASRSLAAGPFHWAAFGAVASAALSADQVLKGLVPRTITLGQEIRVARLVSLTHIRNTGMAFGFFPDWTPAVAALAGVVVAGLLFYFARKGAGHPILPVALGLLAGGSASNLADRIRLGYVTDYLHFDYLHFEYLPSFNLADMFIVIGLVSLAAAYTGVRPVRTH